MYNVLLLEQGFDIEIPIKTPEIIFSDSAHTCINTTHGIFFCETVVMNSHVFLLKNQTLILSSALCISQMKFWKGAHLFLSWWKIQRTQSGQRFHRFSTKDDRLSLSGVPPSGYDRYKGGRKL